MLRQINFYKYRETTISMKNGLEKKKILNEVIMIYVNDNN